MDSELLLKCIRYFPDYLSAVSRTLLRFLDNLCRNSCMFTWRKEDPRERIILAPPAGGGGGGGSPSYGLYRYVRRQKFWFFSRFGHK